MSLSGIPTQTLDEFCSKKDTSIYFIPQTTENIDGCTFAAKEGLKVPLLTAHKISTTNNVDTREVLKNYHSLRKVLLKYKFPKAVCIQVILPTSAKSTDTTNIFIRNKPFVQCRTNEDFKKEESDEEMKAAWDFKCEVVFIDVCEDALLTGSVSLFHPYIVQALNVAARPSDTALPNFNNVCYPKYTPTRTQIQYFTEINLIGHSKADSIEVESPHFSQEQESEDMDYSCSPEY